MLAATRPASRMRRISSFDLRWIRTAPTGLRPRRLARTYRNAAANPRTLRSGEALVVARDEVRLDLLDRVERDAHDDQQAGSTEVERYGQVLLQERRDHA